MTTCTAIVPTDHGVRPATPANQSRARPSRQSVVCC